ncbi:MAG: hexitol phosphatase HxpB [Chitinophagaceae bacterium]
MAIKAAIFDMDGLLIDSEPLWQQAAFEVFAGYNKSITLKQYETVTGLRTKEFIEHWFTYFGLPEHLQPKAVDDIFELVKEKISKHPSIMPGVQYIIEYFLKKDCRIGIATSSPKLIADMVIELMGIRKVLDAISTAEHLPYGKPHPQVYINCAAALMVPATECICFEDSFNGLIAAKAARMKCVVVPAGHLASDHRWGAADLKISSLQNFNDLLIQHLL